MRVPLLVVAAVRGAGALQKKPDWAPPKLALPEVPEEWRSRAKGVGTFLGGTVAGAALAVGVALGPGSDAVLPEGRATREASAQFAVILDSLDRGYVDAVDPKKLLEAAVDGMLKTLDPYTEYESGRAATDLVESVEGRYGGVGLVISSAPAAPAAGGSPEAAGSPRDVTIVDAYENYAWEKGLRPNDRLLRVDGEAVGGADTEKMLEKARTRLRGAPGTSVEVEFRHPWEGKDSSRTATLERQAVRRRDVDVALLPSPTAPDVVAYARVSGFSRETAPELLESLASLRYDKSQTSLSGLILDLRGNPGGLLDAAVDVASLFLPPEALVASAGGRGLRDDLSRIPRDAAHGGARKGAIDARDAFVGPRRIEYRSRLPEALLYGKAPLVVLVDGASASASEIVAGAIQDWDAGAIVGQRTFGKGLIQDVSPLPFDHAALKQTVGRYYTPSGRCLQELVYGRDGDEAPPGARKTPGEKRDAFTETKSEKTTFATLKSRRPIESGGGVSPDVAVEAELLTPGEVAVLRSNVLRDFLDAYVAGPEKGDFNSSV